MSNLECEIKLRISDVESYNRIREELGPPTANVRQKNVFYDTPDRALSKKRWSLRIRHELDRIVLAVKGPGSSVGSAVQRIEWEEQSIEWEGKIAPLLILSADFPEDLLSAEPILKLREVFPDLSGRLRRTVSFYNDRIFYNVKLAGTEYIAELDRTQFTTGQIDYELEVEIAAEGKSKETVLLETAAVHDDLQKLLKRCGADAQVSKSGKISRALRYGAALDDSDSPPAGHCRSRSEEETKRLIRIGELAQLDLLERRVRTIVAQGVVSQSPPECAPKCDDEMCSGFHYGYIKELDYEEDLDEFLDDVSDFLTTYRELYRDKE